MKLLIKKIIDKCKAFLHWVWTECKSWQTLVLLAFVCLILGLPVWGGYLIGFTFKWPWAYGIATIMWGFWLLPGAPFFALSVSITLAIKRIYEKLQEKKSPSDPSASQADGSSADTPSEENHEKK